MHYVNHSTEKMLQKFKHLGIKEVNTPYDSNTKLSENSERTVAQLECTSAIGSMMYVMHFTRLDNPSTKH